MIKRGGRNGSPSFPLAILGKRDTILRRLLICGRGGCRLHGVLPPRERLRSGAILTYLGHRAPNTVRETKTIEVRYDIEDVWDERLANCSCYGRAGRGVAGAVQHSVGGTTGTCDSHCGDGESRG